MAEVKYLKNLLAQGEVEVVIEELRKTAGEDTLNALIIISNELKENHGHKLLNTKSQHELSSDKNRLTKNLLEIIDGSFKMPKKATQGSDFNFNLSINKKTIIILIVAIVLLAIIYFIFAYFIIQNSGEDSNIFLG